MEGLGDGDGEEGGGLDVGEVEEEKIVWGMKVVFGGLGFVVDSRI